jgi:hypothetical protein
LERSARSGGADAFNEAATRTHADLGHYRRWRQAFRG